MDGLHHFHEPQNPRQLDSYWYSEVMCSLKECKKKKSFHEPQNSRQLDKLDSFWYSEVMHSLKECKKFNYHKKP